MSERKNINVDHDAFWKLHEIKSKLKANTWNEFADKLYSHFFENKEVR